MGSALAVAAGVAAVTAAASYASQQAQVKQQQQELNYQATVMANQAKQAAYEAEVQNKNAFAMMQQAEVERQKGVIEVENIHKEKEDTRRQYEFTAGENRSLLAASNVDLTTGSAWDALMGNAQNFSQDIAANNYKKLIAKWNADQSAKQAKFQGDIFSSTAENLKGQSKYYDANASYYQQTAKKLKPSLLTSLMQGVVSGVSAYFTAGGSLAAGAATGAFGGAATKGINSSSASSNITFFR